MKLLCPLKEPNISQNFGENMLPWYKEHGMLGHNGIDYRCPVGTPIYAAMGGVCFASIETDINGNLTGYGHYVVISDEKWRTDYGHLSNFIVKTGDVVKQGDLIGYSGNEGNSTGPHLHFGLKPIPSDHENGYWGAIDPAPYLLSDTNMTNAILVTDGQTYFVAEPATSPDGLETLLKSHGLGDLPRKPDKNPSWDDINELVKAHLVYKN